METPRRIQRKRTKNWKAPLDEQGRPPVNIARPSLFGNPFRVCKRGLSKDENRALSVELFRDLCFRDDNFLSVWIDSYQNRLLENVKRLLGRRTMCFCPEHSPCHGDILHEVLEAHEDSEMKHGRSFFYVIPRTEPGLNRAALVWRHLDGETPAQLCERFELSHHELMEHLARYVDLTETP